ncbi:MAG: ABC transporter substrate-binding protein [Candidatus Competibacterales bacterium]|nr:ABC transporter substrate-binding protein [Candidatus Competibacterales bacterium]
MSKTPLLAAGLAAALGATAAQAQQTLYLGAYGGSTENLMKNEIIPAFEANHDVTVIYVPGNSTDTLAKLQAQQGNQELDVVFLDDGPMYQAIAFGFCDTVEQAPVIDDLYPIARFPNDKAVGVGFVVTGIAYNQAMFEEMGWEPPDSWEDLTDAKFEGKLVVPPINNTYGLHALIMMARLRGGGETDIDPGFEAFIDEVGPNVLTYEPSSGKMSELFQSGEIALSVWGSGRLKALADTGFPGDFAYPEEGGVALQVAACPVVDSDVPDLAQAFIQHVLSPEIQALLADGQGWGPTNRTTELPPELGAKLPYGPEKIEALIAVDWDVINEQRYDWTKRWNRRVER